MLPVYKNNIGNRYVNFWVCCVILFIKQCKTIEAVASKQLLFFFLGIKLSVKVYLIALATTHIQFPFLCYERNITVTALKIL